MPSLLATEKARYVRSKARLFSAAAAEPGTYSGLPRAFCLADDHAGENLLALVRDDALEYFERRGIPWHKGLKGGPTNHLCSSQVACVNTLWPLTHEPDLLARLFRPVLPELAQVLPFTADGLLRDGTPPYLAFEWVGTQNYLKERGSHTRGANATSADFAFRFRRTDGRIGLVLGEWKYTESYHARLPPVAMLNPTRLRTYRAAFERWHDQQPALPAYESFFVEPFYQLMRLTLLAQALERAQAAGHGELEADIVTVVHVVPRANHDFAASLTSPDLTRYGPTVHTIWSALAPPERFVAMATEDLLTVVAAVAPASLRLWVSSLLERYAWAP